MNEEKKEAPHALKAGDVLRNSGIDGDEALKALELEEGETIVIDDEMNRKLIRKIGISSLSHHLTIDWHVMPLLCIIYGLQYLDSTPCLIDRADNRNHSVICVHYGSPHGH